MRSLIYSWLAAALLVTGCGDPVALLALEPGSHDFADVAVGGTSPAATFVVRHTSGGATGTLEVLLQGANAGEFAITSDGCSGITLSSGVSCQVTVVMQPTNI